MQYLIMCRSLTYAQRSAALLERKGISCVVVKAPQGLSGSGCGYVLRMQGRRAAEEAAELLRGLGFASLRVFRRQGHGYSEVEV